MCQEIFDTKTASLSGIWGVKDWRLLNANWIFSHTIDTGLVLRSPILDLVVLSQQHIRLDPHKTFQDSSSVAQPRQRKHLTYNCNQSSSTQVEIDSVKCQIKSLKNKGNKIVNWPSYTSDIVSLDAWIRGDFRWRLQGDLCLSCWSQGAIRGWFWLILVHWDSFSSSLPSLVKSDRGIRRKSTESVIYRVLYDQQHDQSVQTSKIECSCKIQETCNKCCSADPAWSCILNLWTPNKITSLC